MPFYLSAREHNKVVLTACSYQNCQNVKLTHFTASIQIIFQVSRLQYTGLLLGTLHLCCNVIKMPRFSSVTLWALRKCNLSMIYACSMAVFTCISEVNPDFGVVWCDFFGCFYTFICISDKLKQTNKRAGSASKGGFGPQSSSELWCVRLWCESRYVIVA